MIGSNPYRMPGSSSVCSLPGLLYFIWEREVIRIARENTHPAPWTDDPVLSKYKFTNIRRIDDRVSKWILNNVIEPNSERKDLWFVLLISRFINWPPTLQHLIHDTVLFRPAKEFDPEAFSMSVEAYKDAGKKVYSGAYMVYPTKMEPGGVKSLAIGKHILQPALKLSAEIEKAIHSNLVENVVTVLSGSFGVSTFMAGQVAADLTYCKQLMNAEDLYTYAPIGPGSSRGLNYLFNRSPNAGWTQAEFNHALVNVLDAIVSELEIEDLTLHDVQNCLCEYSKYCRTVLGEGKPKTIYQTEKEF